MKIWRALLKHGYRAIDWLDWMRERIEYREENRMKSFHSETGQTADYPIKHG